MYGGGHNHPRNPFIKAFQRQDEIELARRWSEVAGEGFQKLLSLGLSPRKAAQARSVFRGTTGVTEEFFYD